MHIRGCASSCRSAHQNSADHYDILSKIQRYMTHYAQYAWVGCKKQPIKRTNGPLYSSGQGKITTYKEP